MSFVIFHSACVNKGSIAFVTETVRMLREVFDPVFCDAYKVVLSASVNISCVVLWPIWINQCTKWALKFLLSLGQHTNKRKRTNSCLRDCMDTLEYNAFKQEP